MNALTVSDGLRFFAKVRSRPDGCWNWTAATNGVGYGRFYMRGRFYYPHRVAYEHVVGSIPDGMQLDHLCRNRACCNPYHLEPVTNRENTIRGAVSALRDRPRPTHCQRGHAYSDRGAIASDGTLRCRECARLQAAAKRDRPGIQRRLGRACKGGVGQ